MSNAEHFLRAKHEGLSRGKGVRSQPAVCEAAGWAHGKKQLEGSAAYLYAQNFTPYLQEKGSMSARGEAPRDHVTLSLRHVQHYHDSNVAQYTGLDLARIWIVQSLAAGHAAVRPESIVKVLILHFQPFTRLWPFAKALMSFLQAETTE